MWLNPQQTDLVTFTEEILKMKNFIFYAVSELVYFIENLILRKRDFTFSQTKKLFRLFKTIERVYLIKLSN